MIIIQPTALSRVKGGDVWVNPLVQNMIYPYTHSQGPAQFCCLSYWEFYNFCGTNHVIAQIGSNYLITVETKAVQKCLFMSTW